MRVKEWDIYGSKRIGIIDTSLIVYAPPTAISYTITSAPPDTIITTDTTSIPDSTYAFVDSSSVKDTAVTSALTYASASSIILPLGFDSSTTQYYEGQKRYELANHLGNVLVTVSDKKLPVDTTTILNIAQYYEPEIINSEDFYPFGMQEPGRIYRILRDSLYRFNFNGKEKTDEMYGTAIAYDYGARFQDIRLGRFLSIDPLKQKYPWYTPYQFAGNKPIWAIDRDGFEEFYTTKGQIIYTQSDNGVTYVVNDNYIKYFTSTIQKVVDQNTGEATYEKQYAVITPDYSQFKAGDLDKNSELYQNLMNNAQSNPIGNKLMDMYNDDPTTLYNGELNQCSPTSFKRYQAAFDNLNGEGSFGKTGGTLYAIWNMYGDKTTLDKLNVPPEYRFKGGPEALLYKGITNAVLSSDQVWAGSMQPGGILRLSYNGNLPTGHSVIFLGYTYDQNGKITGINYWDQHASASGGAYTYGTMTNDSQSYWKVVTGANPILYNSCQDNPILANPPSDSQQQ